MLNSQLREKVQEYAKDRHYRIICSQGCPLREKGYRPPLLFEHIIHKHARMPRNWYCKEKGCMASFFGTLDAVCHAQNGHKIEAHAIDKTIADFQKLDIKGKDEKRDDWEEPYFVYNSVVTENVIQRLIQDGYLQPGPKLRESRKRATGSLDYTNVHQDENNETTYNHGTPFGRMMNFYETEVQLRVGEEKRRSNSSTRAELPKRQPTPPRQRYTPIELQENKILAGKMSIRERARAMREEAAAQQSSYSGTKSSSSKTGSILKNDETRHRTGTVRLPPVRSMHRDFSECSPPRSPRHSIYPSSPRGYSDLSPYASPRTPRFNNDDDDEDEIFVVPNRFAQVHVRGENAEERMDQSKFKNGPRSDHYYK